MFAVIRTGGKQYRVAPNDIIEIERIAGEPGDIVELSEVLLLGGGDGAPKTGSPISGASVAAEVVEQMRGEKIIVFKKKRRKNYRRKKGHRQFLTMLRITEILTDGKKPSKTKAPKPEPKKAEKKPVEAKPAKPAKPAKKPAAKAAAKPRAAAKPKTAAKAKAKAPAKAKPKPKKS
jgi:large subunit ribosomal protein L21